MSTGRIGEFGIPPAVPGAEPGGGVRPAPAEGAGPSFGEALESALRSVDADLQHGDAMASSYVAGENVDLHNVLLDLQRADLNFRTMVQVRNKLLEAYKEIMRMPV